jgi:hypothetical protein
VNIPIGWEATTRPRRGASGLDHPTRPSRPSQSGPSAAEPFPISRDGEPREKGEVVGTRDVIHALHEQRATLVDAARYPSGLYVLLKIREPGPGLDPRTRDALVTIRAFYPRLSRRAMALTGEGYRAALALLSPLLHPRARGEAPRWKQGVTSQQVSALIDTLTKTKTGP